MVISTRTANGLVVLSALVPLIVGATLNWITYPILLSGRTIFDLADAIPMGFGAEIIWAGIWTIIAAGSAALAIHSLLSTRVNGRVRLSDVGRRSLLVFGIVAIQSVWVRILVGASLWPWVTDNAPSAPSVWLEVIGLLCLLARLTMGIVATSKRGQGIRAGRLPE